MKKSKFLKKSLAMLLAVMLVVAMIPLSASAAPSGVSFIYVNDNPVTLGSSMSVDVSEKATDVEIRTNEDWTARGYQLRVQTNDSQWTEKNVTTTNSSASNFALDDYLQADGTMLINEYKQNGTGAWEKTGTTYVLTVNKVKDNTTTNLDENYFKNVKGVYSVDVDNENKIVNVVLARHTGEDGTEDATDIQAVANLRTVENATFDNGSTSKDVNLNDGQTFVVTSQSKGNKATYTVKATYLDALNTMTVIGLDGEKYTAEAEDTNNDDIPDAFNITMPDSAIYDEHDELTVDPKMGVAFEVEGDTTTNVSVNGTSVKADGSVKIQFTDLDEDPQEVSFNVVTERLTETNGAIQHYTLKVQLQKDNSTDITYAQVNSTIATVDLENNTIVAEVPSSDDLDGNYDGQGATVLLRTAATVSSVMVDGKKVTGIVDGGNKNWEITRINLESGSKVVTVTAEDGTDRQYTLSAKKVSNNTDASITAFYLGDNKGGVTAGEDDIYVTVPYMTIDVEDLPIYVTPTSYTYVTYVDSRNDEHQIVNGTTDGYDIYLRGTIPVDGELTAEIIAHNKNNPSIKEVYTIHVVLEEDVATGNELTDLEFTAQSTANTTDKDVVRAMTEANTFNNEVAQRTSGSNYVQTLNLQVPVSLTKSDLGITYQNIVTGFKTRDEGVAFMVTYSGQGGTGIGNWNVEPLTATTEAIDQPIYGDIIKTGDQIIVLPEEIARKVLTSSNEKTLSPADVKSGTLYNIEITTQTASPDADLKTISVGGYDLIIDGNKITGKLPFSLTTAKPAGNAAPSNDTVKKDGKFINFTISDYAILTNNLSGSVVLFYPNGDTDGDGEANASNDAQIGTGNYYPNRELLFVRNADHTVTVYRCDDSGECDVIEDLTVLAEDRLTTTGDSSRTYEFDLTWAAPCEDADIETFTLGGYEGHINNDPEEGRTINVTVPYGTSVTGMIAEFTTSTGAKVEVGELGGMDFESGVTSLNYTNPVKLYVTSEDEDTTRMYTVTVTQGVTFDDIDENDWFYDDVVDAAENGYVNGMGEGKYQPYGQLTRAQFATMIARAMNYDSNPDVTSAFPDVADDHWAKAAINFCYQNDIIRGYEDGEFKPDRYVTRQEVAAILARAFNLEEISSEEYPDDASIASWASEDVYKAKAAGLMKGDADTGNFRPTSLLNRAEAATILMNANRNGYIN